jgi:two-component system phosphate regulon sensor histidine kinase PhoR
MIIDVILAVALVCAVVVAVLVTRKLRREIDTELYPLVRTLTDERAELSRTLASLRERTETLTALVDNLSEGVVTIDARGGILSINRSAAAMFDTDANAVGRNLIELSRDIEFIERTRLVLSGSPCETRIELRGRVYSTYFRPSSGGAIMFLLDVTERGMSEQMRREFSANVSHELKTPLTIIYGHAEMLAGGIVRDGDKPEFYAKLKDEAARMIALVDDIMLISELDENRGRESFEDTDLAAVASEVVASLAPRAAERDISVTIDGGGVLRANRSMMYELLYNLTDNAIKYNKIGGTVRISITQSDGATRVAVADTGIGIPNAAQSRVFERFYRADKSRSNTVRGTGLGLAIVKHIAAAHGGTVELKSREGAGTEVQLTVNN